MFHVGRRVTPARDPFQTKLVNGYPLPVAADGIPMWRKILKDQGMPADVGVLDFETYFDDVYCMGSKKGSLSTIEYITDKRFEILGMAHLWVPERVNYPDYEADTQVSLGYEATLGYIRFLQDRFGKNLEHLTVVAQNALFELTILAIHFDIYPPHVVDTLGLARAWNSRSNHKLAQLCEDWKLPPKGETKDFSGATFKQRYYRPKSRGRSKIPPFPVVRPLITEEQGRDLGTYAKNDGKREWEVFTILLPRLSNPRTELRLIRHTIELFTKPLLNVSEAKGNEIIAGMEAELDKVVTPTGLTREEISADSTFDAHLSTALTAAGDDARKYQKQTKRPVAKAAGGGFKLAFAIAQADPQRELLCKHPDPTVAALMAARGAIDSWPNHISRVRRIIAQAAARGEFILTETDTVRVGLPVPLRYWGAHTGRWSGGEGINLQNLGDRGHALISMIREMLLAPEGHSLVIWDLSAIEAVSLAYVAGQDNVVQQFRELFNNPAAITDPYTNFATEVLGWSVRKPSKTGIPDIEKRMKWGRSVGKIGVLGCGYGMGGEKAHAYAKGEIDRAMADRIVKTYRSSNTKITQFWKDVEGAFLWTVKYGRPCEMARGLRFESRPDCDLVLTLPNGRELHYHRVKIKADERGDKLEVWNGKEHKWDHLWGGTITENIIQAFARDILAEAFLRIEERGFRVGLHVHDEIILVVPDDRVEEANRVAKEELTRTPVWAPGIPLGAEGVVKKQYGGH